MFYQRVESIVSGAVVMMMGGEGMSVVADPPFISISSVDATIVSPFVTAVVSGGIGPFSYLWSFTVSDPKISVISPTDASVRFQSSGMFPGEVTSATATCTVTDTATGQAEVTPGVVLQFTRDDV